MSHQLPEHGTFLHVGCGSKRAASTPFAGLGWREIRLDIDPGAEPDLIGTMTNMAAVESGRSQLHPGEEVMARMRQSIGR